MTTYASSGPSLGPGGPDAYALARRRTDGAGQTAALKVIDLDVDRVDRALRVTVRGVLDYDTEYAFLATVGTYLDAPADPPADLRLDFAGLTDCDSSALNALITVHRRTTAAGTRFHLDHQPSFLRRMLVLTGLDQHLTGTPERPRSGRGGDDFMS
ncbi:STAS domain-containing protein [Actinacidiphila acididurans]|uniref:STAS domain-containing protein n=1 Tax=Actinacidiphila acididurans TaxID=2784346 RepID=A0ABS2TLV0_9ACTN|nr:STAS domain-containing protein [Actinacidiphila acididurans]MBM9504318.1 STAS domain-containing protein [Actinacidiphila acididurans]